ncbi:hypothetical protein QCA50_000267 [Cerrena zonata]|uniref:4'-phosphopantetheinyl transferase domain-containing protein n=1 Tax=Cerrena zonata TaxID=2478898 RepID=A0AAW0GQ62_9APHY
MGILGVGIDIVSLRRVLALVERRSASRLAHRILSPNEFSLWQSKTAKLSFDNERFLAVRWAVKEAAYKAMFPTYKPTWKELSYYSHNVSASQKPSLVFGGQGHTNITLHVSVSHDGDYIIAQVLAEHNLTK